MTGIEYHTFSSFYDVVLPLVAPEDLAENLIPFFRDQIGNALADIQTVIPWFRGFNMDLVEKGGANGVVEFCNASIFQGPVGKVTHLYAYKPGLDCRKFYYKRVSTAAVDCWLERQRCLCPATEPPSWAIYDSPYCNYALTGEQACEQPYLTAEEDDCRFRSLSADDRIYAVGPDYKIYAAPRFPCGYALLVQWQGIRRKWLDGSIVPVDQQLREAVVNYVEYKMALKERQSAAMSEYFTAYTLNLRMLKYRAHEDMDTSPVRDCTAGIEQLLAGFTPIYGYIPVPIPPPRFILSEDGQVILSEGGEGVIAE